MLVFHQLCLHSQNHEWRKVRPLCPFEPLKPKLSLDLWSHPQSSGCRKTALLTLIEPQTFPDLVNGGYRCTFSKLPLEDVRLCSMHAPEVHNPSLTQQPQQWQHPHWEETEPQTGNNCVCLSMCPQLCHRNENNQFYLIRAAHYLTLPLYTNILVQIWAGEPSLLLVI